MNDPAKIPEPDLPFTAELKTSYDASVLLRTVLQHHAQLAAMADQKAGFLIGGSMILLGIVLGQLSGSDSYGLLAAGLTALVTLALAILAVTPRFKGAPPDRSGAPNTLFFGVFARMDEEHFIEHHLEMLDNPERVHAAMLRDIYQIGVGLYRTKYRYLSYAFRAAFIGYGLSFALALVEFAL